jgi:hypothetical protein
MEEPVAVDVVAKLRAHSIFAHVSRRAGVYSVGVRVVIPDGREAIWDNDGAAGLEAMVLRDGVLVGFVPQIPDSDDLTADEIASIIATTDYDAPMSVAPTQRSAPPATETADAGGTHSADAVTGAQARTSRRWSDRLRRRS